MSFGPIGFIEAEKFLEKIKPLPTLTQLMLFDQRSTVQRLIDVHIGYCSGVSGKLLDPGALRQSNRSL
ncbi:hypothetical protein CR513_07662, partial [Mucuna pruriens]